MLNRSLAPALLVTCGLAAALAPPARAQDAPAAEAAAPVPEYRAWPRAARVAGRDVALHEPAVLSHDRATNAVTLRFPTEVTDAIGRKGHGCVEATATAQADLRSRIVRLTGIAMTGAKLPTVAEADRAEVLAGLAAAVPATALVRLELLTCRPGAEGPGGTEPKFKSDPPAIHVRRAPAVLVQIDGEPLLLDVQNFPLQYVANTATDVFHKPSSGDWWMLLDGRWASSKALTGPWTWLADRLPVELTQLKISHPRGHVRQFIPGTPEFKKRGAAPEEGEAPPIPEVIVAQEPAELVRLYGDPLFTMIAPDVKLMTVANTESDLIFHPREGRYYLLIGGRWFVGEDLQGAWKPAYAQVPKEFAQIPRDHRLAHVLASVPGTPENAEAVAAIALEERATLKKQIRLDVRHADKAVRSVPMADSGAKHVTSTEDDVFEAGGAFYACGNGAWFQSSDGISSFQPVTELPEALKSFSAASGYFHDGFCRPVGAVEDGLEYAISGGYLGAFVRNGLPRHGTGWSEVGLARNENWYFRPRTYGENRWFDVLTGVFQPRTAVWDANGDLVASAWSDYTASYGRIEEYADRYEQGGRRMFPFLPSDGAFTTACGRPHPYEDWAGYLLALNGIPVKELPLGDRRGETAWEKPSLVADADGNVYQVVDGATQVWKDGKWAPAGKPPGVVEDWVRVFARINARPADFAAWAAKRRAPRPINPEITPR